MYYLCSEIKDRYMKYTILQLDLDDPNVLRDHKLYSSWNRLNQHSKFDISQYKKVYEGEVQEEKDILHTLESIFEKFNLQHPSDFHGHSLSVSDVVVLDGVNYYCDSYGWVKTETEENLH